MSPDVVTLVCEGVPDGPDVRWIGLVLGKLAESFEPASRIRPLPAGSKADLGATVRGMRKALRTPHVYAVRDRDYLRAELLGKDEAGGVYALTRHCLESYLVEPELLEAALGLHRAEEKLLAIAERRFWPDLGRAVLDAIGYEAPEGSAPPGRGLARRQGGGHADREGESRVVHRRPRGEAPGRRRF